MSFSLYVCKINAHKPSIPSSTSKTPKVSRPFDPSNYSTRLVALKLAYLGKNYNGFEYHANNNTPLPTVEEALWKALNKAKLIFPDPRAETKDGDVNWEGCEYSKCGRTDKGVSAFGQVIGIRVRSNRPLPKKRKDVEQIEGDGTARPLSRRGSIESSSPPLAPSRLNGEVEKQMLPESMTGDPDYEDTINFDSINDELEYPAILNRLLPPDIKILAWCPSPPIDFSARFSCKERQYRYFFTQPAFTPTPHHLEHHSQNPSKIKDGWLDIEAMRTAAKLFEGLHDFRNFCKIDGGKQISNFERRIYFSDIEEVPDSTGALSFLNTKDFTSSKTNEPGNPKIYTFTLHGSAFLWHQVRCMVSILFLIGQGLESPALISQLLDIKTNPRRPTYELASDTPLVLWDCIFPHESDESRADALQWRYVGEGRSNGDLKFGPAALMDDLWRVWRERKIDETLAGALLGKVASQGEEVGLLEKGKGRKDSLSQRVFDGGNYPRLQGNYKPVMKKVLMGTVEEINEKYAVRKGFVDSKELKELGFRRLNKKPGVDLPAPEKIEDVVK